MRNNIFKEFDETKKLKLVFYLYVLLKTIIKIYTNIYYYVQMANLIKSAYNPLLKIMNYIMFSIKLTLLNLTIHLLMYYFNLQQIITIIRIIFEIKMLTRNKIVLKNTQNTVLILI